jgi:hypothetical protein
MPSSRRLIESQVLGSSAASVTFSGIPSGYRDLVLKVSARSSSGGRNAYFYVRPNGSTTNGSLTILQSNGATASSDRYTAPSDPWGGIISLSLDTADTFGSSEVYIPNYTVSTAKPFSAFSVEENNSATAGQSGINAIANLWNNTAAITSLVLIPDGNFVTGSSFYLYGLLPS